MHCKDREATAARCSQQKALALLGATVALHAPAVDRSRFVTVIERQLGERLNICGRKKRHVRRRDVQAVVKHELLLKIPVAAADTLYRYGHANKVSASRLASDMNILKYTKIARALTGKREAVTGARKH